MVRGRQFQGRSSVRVHSGVCGGGAESLFMSAHSEIVYYRSSPPASSLPCTTALDSLLRDALGQKGHVLIKVNINIGGGAVQVLLPRFIFGSRPLHFQARTPSSGDETCTLGCIPEIRTRGPRPCKSPDHRGWRVAKVERAHGSRTAAAPAHRLWLEGAAWR